MNAKRGSVRTRRPVMSETARMRTGRLGMGRVVAKRGVRARVRVQVVELRQESRVRERERARKRRAVRRATVLRWAPRKSVMDQPPPPPPQP